MTVFGDEKFEYIEARSVLLDALEAIGTHRKAIILVGAQAIYLRIGESDIAVAPYTTDADLVIDPTKLEDKPELSNLMQDAGFELTILPGTWTMKTNKVHVDFLVPSSMGGVGRRGARLGAHGNDIARKANGLEAVIVDHSLLRVSAFGDGDTRSFEIFVAGSAALLIAKLHKIAERKDDKNRLNDKDGLDVLRILRGTEPETLYQCLNHLMTNNISGQVTRQARVFLNDFFANREDIGAQMAARSSAGLEDYDTITISCEVLSQNLLKNWKN